MWLTIRMIAGTPRPSSPTSRASAPWNSTSEEGSDRVPSLSLSRWNSIPAPRSTRKHDGAPPGACAQHQEHVAGRIRAEPLVTVELVHAVAGRLGARDVGADVGAPLALGHRHPGQGAALVVRLVSRGSHSAASSGAPSRSAGIAA